MGKLENSQRSRIAFGSCNSQNLTQPLWDVLTTRNPTAFVWAGDAIYADHLLSSNSNWKTFPPQPVMSVATPERLEAYYQIQTSNPAYRQFLEVSNATIFGTLDDHDMGQNNADETYEYRRESALAFMTFIGETPGTHSIKNAHGEDTSTDSSAYYERARKGYGVYGVKLFDFSRMEEDYLVPENEAGIDPDVVDRVRERDESSSSTTYSERSVAVFVLDSRTHRNPWGEKSWQPNYSGDFLGERQWIWFENALKQSNATVNIIVNGLQVHPYRYPDANVAEVWAQFPSARQRLYDVILQSGAQAPLLVSGDVHMSQLMRKDCVLNHEKDNPNHKIRPLIEFTTSGMTHSWGTVFASTQKFHLTWRYYPMHVISKSIMSFAHFIFPMPDLMVSQQDAGVKFNGSDDLYSHHLFENGGAEGSKVGKQFSLELNFGEIEFDWDQEAVLIRAIGKDPDAPPLLSASYSFDELNGEVDIPGRTTTIALSERYGQHQMDGYVIGDGKYLCMNHRAPYSRHGVLFGYGAILSLAFSFFLIPQLILCLAIYKLFSRRAPRSK